MRSQRKYFSFDYFGCCIFLGFFFQGMHRSGTAMAWNVFKFCTALRGLGSIMILLVLGVVGVTYYVIVIANYGPALYDNGVDYLIALVVLILFHFLVCLETLSVFMHFWDLCYFKVEDFWVLLEICALFFPSVLQFQFLISWRSVTTCL